MKNKDGGGGGGGGFLKFSLWKGGVLLERGGLIEDLRGSRESAHKGQLH